MGIDGDSVYLSPAPLYHSAPLVYSMAMHRLGATCVVMESFEPPTCLDAIERYRVTHAQFVPTMFTRMLRLPDEERLSYDLSSLQWVVHAAAPCPVPVKQQMLDWWGMIIHEYYAGTEDIGSTAIRPEEWVAHPGSVGRPLNEVHIVGDDIEVDLPVGETGTVYFAGGREFEYHNDPEKTVHMANQQGWRTLGDVGYLDADGYLYLTDRASDMVISGGVNIYPREAEQVLATHPQVVDVAVFGVPDEEMGESLLAVVQRQPGDGLPRGGGPHRMVPRPSRRLQVSPSRRVHRRDAPRSEWQALQTAPPGALLEGSILPHRVTGTAAAVQCLHLRIRQSGLGDRSSAMVMPGHSALSSASWLTARSLSDHDGHSRRDPQETTRRARSIGTST